MHAGRAWPMLICFSVPRYYWLWLIVLHFVRLFADSPVFVTVTAMLFICCPPLCPPAKDIGEKDAI